MNAEDVKNLKALEQENARLKKLLAERDLEIEAMKEITRKKGKRTGPWNCGLYVIERSIPQRRACALMQVARSSLHYVPILPQKSGPKNRPGRLNNESKKRIN